MLTLFAIPKAFRGHFETIQRNAIRSWTLLAPKPLIILFGDEDGTAQIAKELKIVHISKVSKNGFGTPLLNDIFSQAERKFVGKLGCFVNSDIILMDDFMEFFSKVSGLAKDLLAVGRRWDIDLDKPLEFKPGWRDALREQIGRAGELHPITGTDFFIFSKGLFGEIPPFAIGRPAYDNWLIFRARLSGNPVIDATEHVMAVHQNHDYSHAGEDKRSIWHGKEAEINRSFAGYTKQMFLLSDATHRLENDRLAIITAPENIEMRLQRQAVLNPSSKVLFRLWFRLLVALGGKSRFLPQDWWGRVLFYLTR